MANAKLVLWQEGSVGADVFYAEVHLNCLGLEIVVAVWIKLHLQKKKLCLPLMSNVCMRYNDVQGGAKKRLLS